MTQQPVVAIIGAGPAGLMAADVLSQYPVQIHIYDAMPSAGRKFLMAGKGGMNITHSEAWPQFLARYAERRADLQPFLDAFDAQALRAWLDDLGDCERNNEHNRVNASCAEMN